MPHDRLKKVPWCATAVALVMLGCGGETDAAGTIPDPEPVELDGGLPAPEPAPSLDEGPWMHFAQRPCPEDNQLTWENFGAAFMLEYCTGCHGRAVPNGARQGAPADVVFDDPNSIRDLEARIWARAADDNASMPPVGGPDRETRKQLGQWLACGAPVRDQL